MKIAVISVSNIYCMPYYYKYEKNICELNNGFDLIYWNRDLIDEYVKPNVVKYAFEEKTTYNDKKFFKILSFYKFYRFVRNLLEKNSYDKIFILGTYSLLTFFLEPYLVKNYKGRYWLDIRDYTYENISWYYEREEKLIRNSCITCISSEGYKEFLPEEDYLIVHNVDEEAINDYRMNPYKIKKKQEDIIRISFIGNVRYKEQNRKLIEVFKNDKRFCLQYFGGGSEEIEKIANELVADNVICKGRFPHEETYKYYRETDIINNCYGNDGAELQTALSNKIYFAAFLKKPILVSPNTYMEKLSTDIGIGFCVGDMDKDLPSRLYNWYKNNFSKDKVKESFIEKVAKDNELFYVELKKIIS